MTSWVSSGDRDRAGRRQARGARTETVQAATTVSSKPAATSCTTRCQTIFEGRGRCNAGVLLLLAPGTKISSYFDNLIQDPVLSWLATLSSFPTYPLPHADARPLPARLI